MVAAFDLDTWRDKAHQRYQRSKERGSNSAFDKYSEDLAAIDGISKIVEWAEQRGYEVYFKPDDCGGLWNAFNKKIRINSRACHREQLHLALHECGHYLVDAHAGESYDDRYRWGYKRVSDSTDPVYHKLRTKFIHRVDVVSEETEAWYRGLKLAQRLGISINRDAFDKTRARALKSYYLWALSQTIERETDLGEDDD